jgi:pimeloyl-ACP methyl ester carboxylesterase
VSKPGATGTAVPRQLLRDGVRLAYEAAGPADLGQAVMLIHGLASNRSRWAELAGHSALSQTHRVIWPCLRGHGGSVTRTKLGLSVWADDLAAILAAEGQQSAVWVGHSLGAQVALRAAVAHPQAVKAVVLIDPVFERALVPQWRKMADWGWAFKRGARLIRGLNAAGLYRRELKPLDLRAMDQLARAALADSERTGDPAAKEAFVKQYSSTWADLQSTPCATYLQDLVELFVTAAEPEAVRQPVLVISSSSGTFASRDDTAREIARFPSATTRTIDCQHWPVTEKPMELRNMVEDFVVGVT